MVRFDHFESCRYSDNAMSHTQQASNHTHACTPKTPDLVKLSLYWTETTSLYVIYTRAPEKIFFNKIPQFYDYLLNLKGK